jgi:hypothetical protein
LGKIDFSQKIVLTSKEWAVLTFFIDAQSEEITKWRNPYNKDEKPKQFWSYPEKIKSRLLNISKPTIGSACKYFTEIEIFEATPDWPEHEPSKTVAGGGKIIYYSLKSDLYTIRILVKLIMDLPWDDIILMLSKPYFIYHINEAIVKEVLEEKKVAIFRVLSLIELNDKLAQSIIDRYEKLNNGEKTVKFEDLVKEILDRFENHHRKDQEIYLKQLTDCFEQFFEYRKDPSIDLIKYYYINDYLLYGLLEGKRNFSYYYQDILDFNYYFRYPLHMQFPVLKDSTNTLNIFIKENPYLFQENSILENSTDDYFQDIIKDLERDYTYYEFEKLVLPVLSLIWISPTALYDFILGDWKSFTLYIHRNHTNQPEILSRLLPIAIADLMKNRKIPKSQLIENIASKLYPPGMVGISEFFTEHGQFNNDRYHRWNERYWRTRSLAAIEMPKNSTLRIKLKCLYELFFDIGYLINTDGSQEPIINISLNIDVNQNMGLLLLSVEDLKNPQKLISKLQNRDNILYNHIRSRLSNKMQNIILYYDVDEKPSIRLQQILVEELNKAMMGADFYDERAFNSLKDKHPKVQETMASIKKENFTKKEIVLAQKDFPWHIDGNTMARNRYLFGKAFEEDISKEFVADIEGWYEKYMKEQWIE